ncbi:MAG TPA: chromosome partitioning protein ParB [Planctomycetaceae bacterium]|nr:chromosome partitioning protein ParB [Planctomycetaceae bacterium]
MEDTNNDQAIGERLEEINGLIAPYRLAWVDPKQDCIPPEKNARYMSKDQLNRLADNIRQDGFLSQLPFGVKQSDGKYLILSGNHRIKAAVKAKQRRVLILFGLEADFDKNRRLALQLSHNAIVGEDDPLILRDIYSEIDDLLSKEYTGLIDEMLQSIKPVELADLPQPEIPLYELRFVFCQAEREYVHQVLDQLERHGVSKQESAVVIGDPDRFIEVITLVKKHIDIQDRSIALLHMCRICDDYLKLNPQPTV